LLFQDRPVTKFLPQVFQTFMNLISTMMIVNSRGKGNTVKSIAAILLLCALTLGAIMNAQIRSFSNAYAQEDSWYVGKGVKPNMYVTYKIQDHDTNQGQPFNMTIYFKEYNDTGKYWVAPVFVDDRGEIINGTFHLSDLDLTALGSSNIPAGLLPYKNAYKNSLQWLEAFVPKPGQSLNAQNWGKIGSIGGPPINPSGTARITVPAGTFDTNVISYHKGVDNKIWVNKDFLYPIKAETYSDVTTGNPPIQYAFELLATGEGQPPIPKSLLQVAKPPLTVQTARGSYFIQLFWEPEIISIGNETKFGVVFMDAAQRGVTDVSYGFKILDENGTAIVDLQNQKAPDGITPVENIHKVKFDKPGPITVRVSIEAVGPALLGDFVESADFKLVVVDPSQIADQVSSQNSSQAVGQNSTQ
jgi:hypothetical protein